MKARIWVVAGALLCSLGRAETDTYMFGVEQEVRNPFLFFTVAPIIDGVIGRVAKEFDVMSKLAGATYLRKLRQQAVKYPDDIIIEGNRVFYPKHNWGFRVTPEYGTVELIFEPISLAKAREMKDILQRDIWDLAAKAGLKPPKIFGAGHVHMALTNFDNDPRHLLNYFIDLANHPGLYFGALANDPANAAQPLQTTEGRALFQKIIEDFDAGKITDIEVLRERLSKIQGFGKPRGRLQGALNAKTKFPTVEFRALRSHPSADHLIAFMELQAYRLDYLKTKPGRIAFEDPGVPPDDAVVVAQFRRYVTDAGGSLDRFDMLLPDWMRTLKTTLADAFRKGPSTSSFLARCWMLFRQL